MKFAIYTKPNCKFCEQAKALLIQKGFTYTEHVLGEDFTRSWIVQAFPLMKTYPIILMNGKLIGGFTELQEAFDADPNFGLTLLLE